MGAAGSHEDDAGIADEAASSSDSHVELDDDGSSSDGSEDGADEDLHQQVSLHEMTPHEDRKAGSKIVFFPLHAFHYFSA